MSDTNDLREQVAKAIALRYTHDNHKTPERIDHWWSLKSKDRIDDLLAQADAALAVAEPVIRAQVLSELAQKAEDEDQCLVSWYQVPGTMIPQQGEDLADWLRAQQERENTR